MGVSVTKSVCVCVCMGSGGLGTYFGVFKENVCVCV